MNNATTIRVVETAPDDYPSLGSPEPTMAIAAWQRIESYIAHRWPERPVTFYAEGPGAWLPPLTPVEIEAVHFWTGELWEPVSPPPAALDGFMLEGRGPYRFSGTAGDDSDPPEVVMEAARRLATYLAAKPGPAGARVQRIGAGTITVSTHRHEAWRGRAIENSGAGDLLRPYRRTNAQLAIPAS